MRFILLVSLSVFLRPLSAGAQIEARPFIWIKAEDRPALLEKIERQTWAATFLTAFRERVDRELVDYRADPVAFLRRMPLDWDNAKAEFPAFLDVSGDRKLRLLHTLQTAIDCGLLYFITEEPAYGRFAADVLFTVIEGLNRTPLRSPENRNSGWLLADHLREAREIGAQVPILYDFVCPYLSSGGRVVHPGTGQRVDFSHLRAQAVFRNYVHLALSRGHTGHNWPILESPSLVGNTLALNDPVERDSLLRYFLTESGPNQDAMPKIAEEYRHHGGYWPESFNYSQGVAAYLTYLMSLLNRYDSQLHLARQYPFVLRAVPLPHRFIFPNGNEKVVFGDGHRAFRPDYRLFEMAHALSVSDGLDSLRRVFGSTLRAQINQGNYRRRHLPSRNLGATFYRDPLHLLWSAPTLDGEPRADQPATTDYLPFAGIHLQRNLSPTGQPHDHLMAVVGGGPHVHGHASGMHLELYGRGHVLGQNGGRGQYRTEIHENYYRIYASNNTVIVNGASRGNGGWVNLATDTVSTVAFEPLPGDAPVSSDHSFSITAFRNRAGDTLLADQERLLGLIRTSPRTGYYVDVFRSRPAQSDAYHDYVYHNLGDTLQFTVNDPDFAPEPDPKRFTGTERKEWRQNRHYRNPGWHYFKQAKTVTRYSGSVSGFFTANHLEPLPVRMRFILPARTERDYTSAWAPPSAEADNAYDELPTPTLVVRRRGDAWHQPFAVVYEPTGEAGTVKSVEALWYKKKFAGLKVLSQVNGILQTQYVFTPDHANGRYRDSRRKIDFRGRYAVVTVDEAGHLLSVYVGAGTLLRFGKWEYQSPTGQSGAYFRQFATTN